MQKLTVKQKEFAEKFVELHGNGTQAALQVYDANNAVTAGAIASENLKKPLIIQEVQSIQTQLRNSIADHLVRTNAITKVIDSCLQDMTNIDAKIVSTARKELETLAKDFAPDDKKAEGSKHLHLHTPNR